MHEAIVIIVENGDIHVCRTAVQNATWNAAPSCVSSLEKLSQRARSELSTGVLTGLRAAQRKRRDSSDESGRLADLLAGELADLRARLENIPPDDQEFDDLPDFPGLPEGLGPRIQDDPVVRRFLPPVVPKGLQKVLDSENAIVSTINRYTGKRQLPPVDAVAKALGTTPHQIRVNNAIEFVDELRPKHVKQVELAVRDELDRALLQRDGASLVSWRKAAQKAREEHSELRYRSQDSIDDYGVSTRSTLTNKQSKMLSFIERRALNNQRILELEESMPDEENPFA